MRALTDGEKVVLLQTLFADAGFLRSRGRDVQECGLLGDGDAPELIFQSIMDYYRQFGNAPDIRLLVEDIKSKLEEFPNPALSAGLRGFWPRFASKMHPVPEYCTQLVLEARRERLRGLLIDTLPNTDFRSPDDKQLVQSLFADMMSTQTKTFDDLVVPSYGDNYIDKACEGVKRPYNLGWLDDMTGGGGSDGDSLLLIVPTSGGKTTMALELGFNCGADGLHTTIMFTEQSPVGDPDISLRQDVLGSGAPRSVWSKIRKFINTVPKQERPGVFLKTVEEQLTRAQYQSWLDGQNVWRNNTMLLDCVDTPVTDLEGFLNDLATGWSRKGVTPYLFIVDWLGPLFASSARSRRIISDRDFYQHTEWVVQTLINFAQKCRLRLVCFHQAAGAALRPNTKGAPTASSFRAAGSTTLPFRFTYSMAASTQFGDGNFWMVADKMRSFRQGRRRLRVDGENCRVPPVREEAASINRM